jgi:uncharacterized protein (DUF433 family)
MSQVVATHIELREGASGIRPRIAGKGILVQAVVVWHQVLRRSPEEIASDHGLTLSEVHAALSYYYDHRVEIDQSIWQDDQLIAEMKAKSPSILQQRLRERFGG